jgi:hypothetical protein
MNDQPPVCPKCSGNVTQLPGGLAYCSACGFEGEEKKPDPKALTTASKVMFWVALLAPAFLALIGFLVGPVSPNLRDLGVGVGFVGLVVDVIISLYCSSWLAKRFWQPGPTRFLVGTGLFFGIAFLNFVLIFAGCMGNQTF